MKKEIMFINFCRNYCGISYNANPSSGNKHD